MNVMSRVMRTSRGGRREDEEESQQMSAMSALDVIHSDHEEVNGLFEQALGEDTPAAQRRGAIDKIVKALTVHAEMEEKLFYPALRRGGGVQERDTVLEANEEHGMVKDMVGKIERSRGRDETMQAKVKVLKELVQHHVREEESTIFNEARRVLGEDKLRKMGAEMMQFKQRAMRGERSRGAAERGRAKRSTAARATGGRKTTSKRNGSARKGAAKRTTRKASTRRKTRENARRAPGCFRPGKEWTLGMAVMKASSNGARQNGGLGRIYGGLSAPARRAERRGRLLDAGLELFGTVGFRKTTIPMLCSASGVTARHFYEEFASREELLRALYDQIADTALARVLAALRASDRDERERVYDGNVAYFRYLTSDPRLAQIYTIEAVGMHAELEAHRREKREAFVKTLTKAAARVEASALDTRLLSAAIAGAAHDLLLEWVLAPRRTSVEKMIEIVTALWVRSLRLDEPARV